MSILNLEGAYENELVATGEFNQRAAKTALRLPSGERIVLPTEVLLYAMEAHTPAAEGAGDRQPEPAQLHETSAPTTLTPQRQAEPTSGERVIPLVEEQMIVGKREVETGRVRLRRQTEEHVQTISVPLTETHWEVEHVSVDQVVDAQPEVRRVGETMIFPLVEERLVVKRELWLKEEVHIRRVSNVTEKSAEFALKRDVLIEDRTEDA